MEILKWLLTGSIIVLYSFLRGIDNESMQKFEGLQDQRCTTPLNQPASLVFTEIHGTSVRVKFIGHEPVDNYLVVRSSTSRLSVWPQDGSRYWEGDALGNAIIVSYGPEQNFIANKLERNTFYHFFVFSVNDNCINGPVYNIAEPLSGKIKTSY